MSSRLSFLPAWDTAEGIRRASELDPDAVWSGTLDDLGPGRASGWRSYAGGPAWVLRAW